MWRLAVASFLLAACSGAGLPRVSEAPGRPQTTPAPAVASGPVAFVPATEAVVRYNDAPPPVQRTVLGDAVTAAVGDAAVRAGLQVPTADARLFGACNDLAEVAPEAGFAGATLDDTVIQFALQRNGIIEPAVRLLFGWGNPDSPARFITELQSHLADVFRDGSVVRFGVGVARRQPDGFGAIVVALQDSGISTLPIPRAATDQVALDAVLDRRFHDPEVFVTYQSGETRRVEVRPGRPGGFATQVACGAHGGRHQIEIIASDASGPTVLANFPVWCAAEPPLFVVVDLARDDRPVERPEQAEQVLLARINRDRAAVGLPALRWNEEVAAVARGYADEMRRTGAVAHISSTTGSASDRLRAAGIATRIVLENVARAYGLDDAHRALMNSPGHRANLMSTEATDVGIGVAFGGESAGRRELFITQVFIREARSSGRPAL